MVKKLRIFFNWIQGYEFGDPERNGEYHFLRSFIKKGMVVLDVGANVGDYSSFIFDLAGGDIELHCFEPVQAAFTKLKQRLSKLQQTQNIYLNNLGLSKRQEKAKIKIYGATAGVNSLYERQSAIDTHPELSDFSEESIFLTTLDDYVTHCNIDNIDLLKIDVEGHELKVIEGATSFLASGRINVIQFEYGGCFLDSGAKLEDIFILFSQKGYKLFRLLPYGKIRVKKFQSHLENYKYSNWIAIKA